MSSLYVYVIFYVNLLTVLLHKSFYVCKIDLYKTTRINNKPQTFCRIFWGAVQMWTVYHDSSVDQVFILLTPLKLNVLVQHQKGSVSYHRKYVVDNIIINGVEKSIAYKVGFWLKWVFRKADHKFPTWVHLWSWYWNLICLLHSQFLRERVLHHMLNRFQAINYYLWCKKWGLDVMNLIQSIALTSIGNPIVETRLW